MKNEEQTNSKLINELSELRQANEYLNNSLHKYKLDQEQLHRSIRRLMLAMEATSDGIWDLDLRTNQAYYSPSCCYMLGFNPNEIDLNISSFKKLIHPDDNPGVKEKFNRHLENQAIEFRCEFRMKNKAGGWKWVLSRGKVVESNKNGDPIRMVGTLTDIDHLKQVESSLKESDERFRSVIESSPDSIHIVNESGEIVYWNKAAENIFGYTKEEVLGRPQSFLMPPALRDEVEQQRKNFLQSDICSFHLKSLEGTALKKNGCTFPVETSMSVWRMDDKYFFSTILRDLTEKKEIENELKKSRDDLEKKIEERTKELQTINIQLGHKIEVRTQTELRLQKTSDFLENVFQATGEGIVVTDASGYIIMVNRKVLDIFNYEEHELAGEHFTIFRSKEYEFGPQPPLIEKLYAVGFIENFEITYSRKNSIPFPAEINIVLLRDVDGTPKGAIASIRDITERKQAEEQMIRILKAVEGSSDAIGISNPQGCHFYQNQAFTSLFGYSVAELRKPLGPKVLYADADIAHEVFKSIMQGNSWTGDITMVAKSGRRFPVSLRANAIKDDKGTIIGLIGLHTDITERTLAKEKLMREIEERKSIEVKLRARDIELHNKADELAEVNSALKVLLKRTEEDKNDVEEKILFNVKELVVAYIEKMKNSRLDERQKTYLNIIESNLNNIISPFGQKLSVKYSGLTSSEIHIANLIKEGKSTRDIAELLNLSNRTIDFHRKNIRHKLGIKNEKANLRSMLLSIE